MISLSAKMLRPALTNGTWFQVPVSPQSIFGEQVFGPLFQGAAQTFAHRDAKTHLGAVDERLWHVAVKHLPQEPLGLGSGKVEVLG